MATWISHFRIADYFLNKLDNVSETEFIVGNIGPDCGEPNDEWSEFTPPTETTHWRSEASEFGIDLDSFYEKYLDKKSEYRSFYLGYYIHLLTDIEWGVQVYYPKKEIFAPEFERDSGFIWTMKKDWYDLDHLFLRENPNFYPFKVFSSITEFPNKYLEYYSQTAMIRQIKYISGFYQNFKGNLDREYPYLTKEEMSEFVEKACKVIHGKLRKKGLIK
jgi:hypothetical protein